MCWTNANITGKTCTLRRQTTIKVTYKPSITTHIQKDIGK